MQNRDDEDVRLDECRFLGIKQFAKYTGLGKNYARILAEKSGSMFRVKSKCLVDRQKFDTLSAEEVENIMK